MRLIWSTKKGCVSQGTNRRFPIVFYDLGGQASMKARRDADGLTAYRWAEELFEFEYCAECGGEVRDHTYALLLGHWLARCKAVPSKAAIDRGEAERYAAQLPGRV